MRTHYPHYHPIKTLSSSSCSNNSHSYEILYYISYGPSLPTSMGFTGLSSSIWLFEAPTHPTQLLWSDHSISIHRMMGFPSLSFLGDRNSSSHSSSYVISTPRFDSTGTQHPATKIFILSHFYSFFWHRWPFGNQRTINDCGVDMTALKIASSPNLSLRFFINRYKLYALYRYNTISYIVGGLVNMMSLRVSNSVVDDLQLPLWRIY